MLVRTSLGIAWIVLMAAAGCDGAAPSNGTPSATVGNSAAPPPPPPPPPPSGGSGAGSAATATSPSGTAAGEAPIPELAPYWGKNYIVFVFAPERNSSYQQVRKDWEAKRTDSQGQPIIWVEAVGPLVGLTAQIEGGPSLNQQSTSTLHDIYGSGGSVTAAYLVGKDGKLLLNKRRGGEIGMAEALAPL